MEQKASLFSRITASVLVFIMDNAFILLALGWFVSGDFKMAAACLIVSFYLLLKEIRDGMRAPQVTVTLNSRTLPHEEPTV